MTEAAGAGLEADDYIYVRLLDTGDVRVRFMKNVQITGLPNADRCTGPTANPREEPKWCSPVWFIDSQPPACLEMIQTPSRPMPNATGRRRRVVGAHERRGALPGLWHAGATLSTSHQAVRLGPGLDLAM